MLSKSQARGFFLSMTAGFSLVFLGLTVDTLRQVPERSHEDKLTPEVARGKAIWESNNCMGCHTLLGEGAYYAPELTKVVERRGAAWIDAFLQDPERMFPGRRKMVKYDFSKEDREAVIAFLGWVGAIDSNGFPAAPDMAPPRAPAASASVAAPPAKFGEVCKACHAVGGAGGAIGPALDGVASRFNHDATRLDAWLSDPAAIKPGTAMPKLPLTPDERRALVDWLLTLN